MELDWGAEPHITGCGVSFDIVLSVLQLIREHGN